MKTENTLENKAKFFAIYLDQEIHFIEGWNRGAMINDAPKLQKEEFKYLNKAHLELTPLSKITNEDACHVCMLLVRWQDSMSKLTNVNIRERIDGEHGNVKVVFEFAGSFQYTIRLIDGDWLGWINSNGRCEWTLFNIQQVNDYLRSKGYALPFLDLSVEDLISYGWVKLKS